MDGDGRKVIVRGERQMSGCHVFCAGLGWAGLGWEASMAG